MELEVDKEALDMGIRVASRSFQDIKIRESPLPVLDALVMELKAELRGRYREADSLLSDPVFRALRDFYWRIGIDPTKTRPASEAIVRRLMKKDIPSINSLVDAGNLASAWTRIPIGIYDLDRMKGRPVIALTRGGEAFDPIGSPRAALGSGTPVMMDDKGVVHLYPYRDSMRTRITLSCQNALIVSCGVRGIGQDQLDEAIKKVGRYFSDLSTG
ncbi:MAG: phenylalanine--tRNA ligase beta subunit-related protein [Candidatus Thermoplasmatota archaeon]|nr:phenylalanine--tRNA ligase beta subunit-related protein [Candidatus Thermoplasmatota archaeon]